MRRFARRRNDGPQDVDISPLIDMVFILLIFFMVSTTFVKDMKLELDRPSAQAATRARSTPRVTPVAAIANFAARWALIVPPTMPIESGSSNRPTRANPSIDHVVRGP